MADEQVNDPNPPAKSWQQLSHALLQEYDTDQDGDLSNNLTYWKPNSLDSELIQVEITQHQHLIQMRKDWSRVFIFVTWAIILFEITLTTLVGLGWLKFEDPWFLRLIILGGFSHILSMPIVITQFLFSKNSLLNNDKKS